MKKTTLYAILISLLLSIYPLYAAQIVDVIYNSAEIAYTIDSADKNQTTNEVNLTIAQTKATIEFLALTMASQSEIESIRPTMYLDSTSHWRDMPHPTLPDGSTLTPPIDMGVQGTSTYSRDDLVIIRLVDIDQDTNASSLQRVEVNITNPNTGDVETLLLQETSNNSGIFVG